VKKHPRRFILNLYNRIDRLKYFAGIKPKENLIILTAADSSHFKSLVQFIKSVKKYESNSTLIIYNLGLTEEEDNFIKNNFKNILFNKFDYSKYPSYLCITENYGQYAWKAVVVFDVLNQYKGKVLWMDAGCVITQPLFRIRDCLKKNGFYCGISKGVVREWTHSGMLNYIGCNSHLLEKRNLSTAAAGFNYDCEKARAIVDEWRKYSLIKECIAPDGSDKSNHRQDESLLTVLFYKHRFPEHFLMRRIGFKIHQDID